MRLPKLNRRAILLFLGIMGPGLITAVADNDAGGIATYSSTGASYGYEMLWMIFLITISLGIIQEMCARMGAVTGKGLSDLIRENFGVRWTAFAMLVLLVANAATTVAEFAGIAAGMELLGVSRYIAVPLAAAGVWLLVVKGSYKVAEKVFLFFAIFQLAYVAAGFITPNQDWALALGSLLSFFSPIFRAIGWLGQAIMPAHISQPLQSFPTPVFRLEANFILLFIATIGTTIAPWMQFYIQSSVRDKGITAEEYRYERWDVLFGAFVTDFVSFFIIITTAATLHRAGIRVDTAADAAIALEPLAGVYSKQLFAVGLVGAATLAASILPLSTAYAVCEAFGWESGISKGWDEARAFFGLYTAIIAIGAGMVLLPNLDLIKIMLLSQDVNGILLPVVLIFMLLLINNKRLMGRHVNGRVYNFLAWTTTVAIIILTILLLVTSVFPGLLR
jgi:NRAMP (natural resistance-associated macrophage protein)-like metal ion transporter